MSPVSIIEKLSLVAPLGLCFHDAATGERIADGLAVSVFPASNDRRNKRAAALPNRSGVYVLHRAAGFAEFTRGAGDAAWWEKILDQKRNFIAEVVDREGRFLPFRFALELPVKGIYRWRNAPPTSPANGLESVPLYSAPARKITGGMASIRAEFRENPDKAAAFAVLEARLNGVLVARGIADRAGQMLLVFPAPAPSNNPIASPPSDATRIALAEQRWTLDLTLKYEPRVFQTSPPTAIDDAPEFLPDLRLALAQANGTLWATAAKNEILTTAVLEFGRELILRSRHAPPGRPAPEEEAGFEPCVFVSPA
ncbi:MAG TPA: hypothetical protein VIL74_13460 [Pyrinomonadaceae bacterium]|jgi:hypothetical protein